MPPSLHTQKQQDIPRFTTANQFLNRGPSLYHLLDHPSATCLPTNRILLLELWMMILVDFFLSFQHFLNTMIVYLYISLPYFMTLSVVRNNVQKYISGSCYSE
jgi:hypothetical protein